LLDIAISKDGSYEIARRSRGTPRIALRLLRRVRDFAHAGDSAGIDAALADHALKRLEVDSIGLDSADHRYLRYISDHYQGGPVGVETIAAGLSEQRDAIEETIEPYLLQIGFIQRTPRGRLLTQNCFKHLGLKPPVQIATLPLLDEMDERQ
jgi:Holliday junction DNA helicase RuvB